LASTTTHAVRGSQELVMYIYTKLQYIIFSSSCKQHLHVWTLGLNFLYVLYRNDRRFTLGIECNVQPQVLVSFEAHNIYQ